MHRLEYWETVTTIWAVRATLGCTTRVYTRMAHWRVWYRPGSGVENSIVSRIVTTVGDG